MFSFSLSQADLQTVMKALGTMPLSESIQAYVSLQNQLAKAQQANQAKQASPLPPEAPAKPNGIKAAKEPPL